MHLGAQPVKIHPSSFPNKFYLSILFNLFNKVFSNFFFDIKLFLLLIFSPVDQLEQRFKKINFIFHFFATLTIQYLQNFYCTIKFQPFGLQSQSLFKEKLLIFWTAFILFVRKMKSKYCCIKKNFCNTIEPDHEKTIKK